MIPEQSLIDQLHYTITQLDPASFITIVNEWLGTDYTYDDISWNEE